VCGLEFASDETSLVIQVTLVSFARLGVPGDEGQFVALDARIACHSPAGAPMTSAHVPAVVRTFMGTNGKTVLLVEDNEDNRIVYSTILRHFGYEVSEALNGEEGIAKARAERPDLILMDISIPIIDGWEATQVLKHDPITRDIPIIALTAHALASDREKAMEVGCDGYLAKPCEPRAVVAEVQRFLGKDAAQNAG
jgi:CheY-like chemotaxis protein